MKSEPKKREWRRRRFGSATCWFGRPPWNDSVLLSTANETKSTSREETKMLFKVRVSFIQKWPSIPRIANEYESDLSRRPYNRKKFAHSWRTNRREEANKFVSESIRVSPWRAEVMEQRRPPEIGLWWNARSETGPLGVDFKRHLNYCHLFRAAGAKEGTTRGQMVFLFPKQMNGLCFNQQHVFRSKMVWIESFFFQVDRAIFF